MNHTRLGSSWWGEDQTRYVDCSPTSEVTPVTIRYIHLPHHGHTSQYHGHEWMTHIHFCSMSIGSPIPDKAISDSDLETPRSRSWVWSKGKVIQRPSILLIHFFFISHQSDQQFLKIQLFRNLTLKHSRSMSRVKSKVNVTYQTQYPTDALLFRFTSIRQTIPEIWPRYCLT